MKNATKLYLLGAAHIEHRGQPVQLARRKALALIAYLAVTEQQHNRHVLSTLLWPEYDDSTSRAYLRQVLVTLNETPLKDCLLVTRDTVGIKPNRLWVDVLAFNEFVGDPFVLDNLVTGLDLYRDSFMSGFSLRDSAIFDDWQSMQSQMFQQRFLIGLNQLTRLYIESGQTDNAVRTLQRLLSVDPLNEIAQEQLIRLLAQTGQRTAAMEQYESYARLMDEELGAEPETEIHELYTLIKNNDIPPIVPLAAPLVISSLPPVPSLFIGREVTLQEIRTRLMKRYTGIPAQVVIQGWPGIGKTTLTAMLAHDPTIRDYFPDGVLWTSLGEHPDILDRLAAWGRAVGLQAINNVTSIEEASTLLSGFLRDRRLLLIIDDVWESEHAQPFRLGGAASGTIITTRMNALAAQLAHTPGNIYKLPILTVAQSLDLLNTLAPGAVAAYPDEATELARSLEGLPLALQVAGRLLNAEMSIGWGISDLLAELQQGARLLAAQSPADRAIITEQTTPTIAALLERSVIRLPPELQEYFAILGVFAPKPATFTLDAIQSVWLVDDPKPYIRTLIDRGLLEPASAGQFQMHALLVMYARSMFDTEGSGDA